MSRKKRKRHKDKIIVQKIKEDPIWRKRAEILNQMCLRLDYVAKMLLKELERVYKGVQG